MTINQLPPAMNTNFQLPPAEAEAEALSIAPTAKMPNMNPMPGGSKAEQIIDQLTNLLGQLINEVQSQMSQLSACNGAKDNASPLGASNAAPVSTGLDGLPPELLQMLNMEQGGMQQPVPPIGEVTPEILQMLNMGVSEQGGMPANLAQNFSQNALPPAGAASMPTAGASAVSAAPASTGQQGLPSGF